MRHAWRPLRSLVLLAACGSVLCGFGTVRAAGVAALTVTVSGIKPGGVIPRAFAYCVPAKQGHVTSGPNRSPAIKWSKGPAGTASYAIIMDDPDAPTVFDTANQEGKIVPADLKRGDFHHWVLVDVPPRVTGLPEGAESTGHGGKPVGPTKYGLRGANSVGDFGRPGTKGPTGGYDGPCPPWNDAIPHHYHFDVYALDVRSLGLSGGFTIPDALRALQGHVLAKGEVVGVYTLNPDVAKTLGVK
jgi:Raf kinase inhibitor-like YbhB/YbcL family protein